MHARVVTVQLQPGKRDDAVTIYRDFVLPAARRQRGFKGALLLTDPNTGKTVSVTFWETEVDMAAGRRSGFVREQIAKLEPVLTSAPSVTENFEVCFQIETSVGPRSRCARVHRRQQIPPNSMDGVIQAFSEQGERVAATVPGYGGSFSMINRDEGKTFSVALWETEEANLAHTPAGDADAITNEPPVRESYQVSIRGWVIMPP